MQDISSFESLDQLKGASFDEALGVMQDIGRFHVSKIERVGGMVWNNRRGQCKVLRVLQGHPQVS
jgi:hypothetical protein